MSENTFDDLDFGVEQNTKAPLPQIETNAPFDYEFNQGKFYCFKIGGERYQFLAGNGAYHLLERLKNGVLMEVEYIGITDCSSFKDDKMKSELNEIEVKLLETRKEINNYPNLDTIPKESEMYKEVSALWNVYYTYNKRKVELSKTSSSNDYEKNVEIEAEKAREFTKRMKEKAQNEGWTRKRLNAELYPNTDAYEKFTPNADDETREKILDNM